MSKEDVEKLFVSDLILVTLLFLGVAWYLWQDWMLNPWYKIIGLGLYGFGCWMIVLTFTTLVRTSEWLPNEYPWHSLYALLAAPVMAVPALVKACIQCTPVAGFVLLNLQFLGLIWNFFGVWTAVQAVPVLALLVMPTGRFYLFCYTQIEKNIRGDLTFIYVNLFWPFFLLWCVLSIVFYAIMCLLFRFWLILLAGLVGMYFGNGFLGLFAGAGLALLPLVGGIAMSGVLPPTGDGGGFDDFSFNPANGLPMIGGMGGVDIHGNSFGTNWND